MAEIDERTDPSPIALTFCDFFYLDALDRWQPRRAIDLAHAQALGLGPDLVGGAPLPAQDAPGGSHGDA